MLLTEKVEGLRLLLLAGRSWKVTWIDWTRRRCFIEPAERGGKARWMVPSISGASYALARAVREEYLLGVHPAGTVITRDGDDVRWWTWAGYRANATLAARLADLDHAAEILREPVRFLG